AQDYLQLHDRIHKVPSGKQRANCYMDQSGRGRCRSGAHLLPFRLRNDRHYSESHSIPGSGDIRSGTD
ncbi:hypothetical protein FRB90_009869, partial [Tulasnella sp. 427]